MHELFEKRYAVRQYKETLVEPEKIEEILAAADSAPSAGNLKAREIVVVKDVDLRERLAAATFSYQKFVGEAPVVLVFCAVPKRSAAKYAERGENLYALQDATIAGSFAWLEAVDLGLGCCWVGAFNEDEVRNILNLSSDFRPIALLPVGYPG